MRNMDNDIKKNKQILCRHRDAGVDPNSGTLCCYVCQKTLNNIELQEALDMEYGKKLGGHQFKLVVYQELEVRAKLKLKKELERIKIMKDNLFERNKKY
jgi:hypothetical protein